MSDREWLMVGGAVVLLWLLTRGSSSSSSATGGVQTVEGYRSSAIRTTEPSSCPFDKTLR